MYSVGQTQLGSFSSLITNQSNNTRENGKIPLVVDRWQLPRIEKNIFKTLVPYFNTYHSTVVYLLKARTVEM
jgi:hypothetical protein